MAPENPILSESAGGSKLLGQRLAFEELEAERIQAHRLDKVIIIVQDTDEYRRRQKLPKLLNIREIDIRYDEIGNIYVPWYQPKEIGVEDKKRFLKNPEGTAYKILYPKRTKDDYLNNLPKRRFVHELILGQTFLLQDAINQQRDILEKNQPGKSALKIDFPREVVAKTEEIAFRFLRQRRMSKEDLAKLASETDSFLEKVGLYKPRDPRKGKILEKFTSLSELDPEGKHTYLGILSIILAAHAAATGRIIVSGLIADKSSRHLQALIYLDESCHRRFELTARELEMGLELLTFNKKDYPNRTKREEIARNLELIVDENLLEPKINPYLRAARWAQINIVGCREEKKEENSKIMGELIAKEVFSRIPVTKLIVMGNFAESKIRIRQSINQLRKPHFDYGNIEKT